MMKLKLMHPEACPIRAECQRQSIGEFDLSQHGNSPLHSFQLPPTRLEVTQKVTLIIEASYVPSNHSFSIIVSEETSSQERYVLAVSAESKFLPVSLVVRLSSGDYVEVYLVAS